MVGDQTALPRQGWRKESEGRKGLERAREAAADHLATSRLHVAASQSYFWLAAQVAHLAGFSALAANAFPRKKGG